MKNKNRVLGLVIVDGVGFRNFILSDFFNESQNQFEKIIIFSGLPISVYKGIVPTNCIIEELEDFRESSVSWFFRKAKEIAHLKNNSKYNFGIGDNLKANYTLKKNKRGLLVRFIYFFTSFFHSEYWIHIFYRLQQMSFRHQPATLKFYSIFKKHTPHILFFTHQRPPFIAPLIYAAKKQDIPTATFIFSWDNLASKGRMAGDFDFYLVWSELMKKELLQFYTRVRKKQIFVVGTPQFEPYVLDRYYTDKHEFTSKFGLDPELKTICYSCGDVSTSKNDGIYITAIARAIEQNAFGTPLNFLVRTSPAEDAGRFKEIRETFSFIKWNVPDWKLTREHHAEPWSQRVPSIEDVKDLRAVLMYSDIGINMCSTMSLDFMNFDKPVINPVFGNSENGLYNDQRFLKYAHYERVVKSKAVTVAKNSRELYTAIKGALNDPDFQKEERAQLFKLQVSKPLQGTGTRIVETLKNV